MINTIHKTLRLLLVMIICLGISQQTDAANTKTVITDSAGLLSTDDIAALTDICNDISTQYNASIYIITTNTMGREDNYSDYLNTIINDKKSPQNLILLFISTKETDSFCVVLANGDAKQKITQDRCDNLVKALEKELPKGDAYTAIDHFTDTVVDYFRTEPFTDFILFHPILQLLFCLAVAGIALFLAAANPLPRHDFRHLDYASDEHSEQLGHLDTLLRVAIQKKRN